MASAHTPTTEPTANAASASGDAAFASPAPIIDIRGLGKQFSTASGNVVAIDNIDLSVRAGEFLVIVGPSGSGKTTLLRILAGLETATAGSLSLSRPGGGQPTNAMVFQGRSVFPWLSVRDNVAYGLTLRGIPKRQRRAQADELLALVGLGPFADLYPHQISEGMRQRVAIARALAVDPDILLMDEPFGALDEQTRFLLQEELLRIWEQTRKTIVFITHSIDEALTMADRVVVLSAHPGRIIANLDLPFPRPRELSAVRSNPEFAHLFTTIWDLLRVEVNRARAAGEVIG